METHLTTEQPISQLKFRTDLDRCMLDGITLTTAELITLFDPDIWDQNTSTDDLSELPEIQG